MEQNVVQQDRIDAWFEAKTRGLTGVAKAKLKQRWGNLQKMFSSKARLGQIVADIVFDMETKPRLHDGRGNAMLVAGSIYQACKFYELFQETELKGKCAIVTSYHYTVEQIKALEREVTYYIKVRDDVRLASGDYVDLKKYDPDMRHLIDTYLSADPSRVLTSFGGATLVELLVDNGISALKDMPSSTPKEQEAVAETIKNMYIRVLPPDGKVQITAPHSAGDDAIRMFAVSRISWIKKQRASFEAQARQTKRQYVTGESYYVWGRRYRLDVQYSNVRNEVSLTGGHLILQVRPESTPEQREHVLNDWYREQLKSKLPEVILLC